MAFTKREVFLGLLLLWGLDVIQGELTLSTDPSPAVAGSQVIMICTSTVTLKNVTWIINGRSDYFSPSGGKRVFANIYRNYTVASNSLTYNLIFIPYRFDNGGTWQCVDDGVQSNVVTFFQTDTGTSGSSSTALTDENLGLIGGLCALGGLLFIVLTIIICWCLGRNGYPEKTVRREYIRDPVPYITEPVPSPRTTYSSGIIRYKDPIIPRVRTSLVMADNPAYADRSLDVYGYGGYNPLGSPRMSSESAYKTDSTRLSSKFVDVVHDSYEGRDPDDLYTSKEVYARVIKTPRNFYV